MTAGAPALLPRRVERRSILLTAACLGCLWRAQSGIGRSPASVRKAVERHADQLVHPVHVYVERSVVYHPRGNADGY